MTKIFLGIMSFLLVGCFIYCSIRLFMLLFGMSLAINKGNKEARLARTSRKTELKNLSVYSLRELLRNDVYLNHLKGSRSLKNFFENLDKNNEEEIVNNINQSELYDLLTAAEYERGHKGRPEANDNVAEIWDIIKEISLRKK